jgi:hypothetical protein
LWAVDAMRWHRCLPDNNAMKLTKPIQVRAPRHSASLHGAPCRVARSSLMRASQLIAVFYVLTEGHGVLEAAWSVPLAFLP